MDSAHRGETALASGDYLLAISLYTAALASTPSPVYHIKRSIAYQRTNAIPLALKDAETAVFLATKRAKRELIAQAQLRRGIALYHLERYGDAEYCFGVARRLDGTDKSFGMWSAKVVLKLRGLEEGDVRREVRVKEMPDVEVMQEKSSEKMNENNAGPLAGAGNAKEDGKGNDAKTGHAPIAYAQTPADKIRHEWYQNNENVYITLLVKGVPKELTSIEIEPDAITISFPLAIDSAYNFSLDPLYGAIDTTTSTSKILATKIELALKKSKPGQKWPVLEGTNSSVSTSNDKCYSSSTTFTTPIPNLASTKAKAPSYPTSSKSGPKDWDKVVLSYSKPKSKSKTESKSHSNSDSDSPSKEDDDDTFDLDAEDGGDPADSFFKTLYKGASEETKRAMMKSYYESNGTALSTNWEEVSKGPVKTSPPDGMEAKEWGS